MTAKLPIWKILFSVLLLMFAAHLDTVHAQSDCDPATGQNCSPTAAPTCGLPGLPPCDGGSDAGTTANPKPKPTRTSLPPVFTRTFTPTPTATPTSTPEPSPSATSQPATLPPRPTEPSLTPTKASVNPSARQASTPIPYVWQVLPIDWGGSPIGTWLLFGVVGALIIIGILWFRARSFADGSVREKPLLNDQITGSNGTNNFFKIQKNAPGEANFMKEVFRDDNSFGDSLGNDGTRNKQ